MEKSRGFKWSRIASSRLFWAILILAVLATVAKAILNSFFEDFKGRGELESESLDEARSRGILVGEVVADPIEADIPGGQIHFGQAWVEERSLPTHRFVWFPAERRKGGYRLLFRAKVVSSDEGTWPFVVPNDERYGVKLVPGDTRIYGVEINSKDLSGLRLSVLKSWSDTKAKNIRFIYLH